MKSGMEFATYYDVTELFKSMVKNKELDSIREDEYVKMYLCEDVNDFWICRIIANMNKDYDREDGKYLLEREMVSVYDFLEHLVDNESDLDFELAPYDAKRMKYPLEDMLKWLMKYDNYKGYENWDTEESEDLEELIEMVDGGFGIINYKTVQ